MPELPEVETVRRGLLDHVAGHVIEAVTVKHPRSVRRHLPGGDDLAARLAGLRVRSAERRGKFLWLTLDEPQPGGAWAAADEALVVHLGMSGQMLVQPGDAPLEKHAHIVATLDSGAQLRFVDQRTFGGWALHPLVEVDGTVVPEAVAHIARDPLDPAFDAGAVLKVLRGKQSEIKRVLLDQTVISGIGNIYADESLWRARIHPGRPACELSRPAASKLVAAAREVMTEALVAGGTSFDAMYVNVNGNSGYFSRSLNAYGLAGEPCGRCGTAILREKFMNRSSYYCPRCQRQR
ncbi:bifunctional DNA-formamidopyrimidine glycosylase/DNA-(apurinic or apyrimidinic site) lyase [Nocardia aurantia]|uniref:Formamidopyrimidine-DNA glycosylase n=1 Tax=Nocardia aurantia TaxID=2585199 RepID=A0A7K0DQT8_9NOCA|nr:bifunctional DNA-formamidopyrimidine glycosylase/DNA-(apurinic or apyrimidinic site) lyase [Nocardia aurantia]MQY28130.1 Formamidopyrimidine-DNA glycosylase 1 [Nocardia aurantia]